MKFEQSGLGFQNLYNIPQGVEAPWLTYQQFNNLVGTVTDMVIAEQNWQPVIDAIWENRTVEDYETTGSTVKTDFMRKWHHNRSGKPISLDEMIENEDGDIFEVADPFDEHSRMIEVQTHNTNLKKRLTAFVAKYPQCCRQTDDDEQGGLTFEIEKGRFSFRLTAPYSAERRRAASKAAKKCGVHRKVAHLYGDRN